MPNPSLPRFRNVFFDLGGVLFNLNTRLAFCGFAEMGMPFPQAMLDGTQPINGSADGTLIERLIHRMDLGEVSGPEFVEIIRAQCRPGMTAEQVIEIYNRSIDVPRSRLELCAGLRQRGLHTYLVSNIGDIHWAAAQEKAREQGFPMDVCFDHCFCSFEMGVAKPDPRYFEIAIRESGVNPAETLYIDDLAANIEAGRAQGLLGFHIAPNTLEEHVSELFG